MFTVYHSNQLDLLKSLLCQLMRLNPLDDPFEPDVVLVQSPGMAQWLRLQVAQEFGIAANMEFPLPATFIWNMFTCVLPDIPKQSAFGKEAMTWKLMTLLPEQLDDPLFEPLRHYLQGDLHAAEKFRTGKAPETGSVLVFRPEGRMSRGHVAVVSDILTDRVVRVTHANWGGSRGKVEENVTVVDVSPANDWSQVKVWYNPINGLGTTVYPTYGFIYKGARDAFDAGRQMAANVSGQGQQ